MSCALLNFHDCADAGNVGKTVSYHHYPLDVCNG